MIIITKRVKQICWSELQILAGATEFTVSMVALLSFAFLVLSTSLLLQQGNAEAPAAIAPRVTRAAMSDQIQKWENGIIYYTFDSSVSIHFRNILRDAMDEWEDNTCVIFKAQKDETPNFVEFYSRPNEEYCTCDSKGDRGGKQLIKLGYTCQEKEKSCIFWDTF